MLQSAASVIGPKSTQLFYAVLLHSYEKLIFLAFLIVLNWNNYDLL